LVLAAGSSNAHSNLKKDPCRPMGRAFELEEGASTSRTCGASLLQMHTSASPHISSVKYSGEDNHWQDGISNTASKVDPVDAVQMLAGTSTKGGSFISDGNTLPQVKVPWGFNDWVPQTDGSKGAWWFNRNDKSFEGMRCTHQPSPWIGDYGNFLLLPHLENVPKSLQWNPEEAVFRPYLFNASLENIGFEFAPTSHAAIMRITPPSTSKTLHLSLIATPGEFAYPRLEFAPTSGDGTMLRGRSTNSAGGVSADWAGMFFVLKTLSLPEDGSISLSETSEATEEVAYSGKRTLRFEINKGPVVVAVATSFISQEQAELNLQQEIGTKSFDDVMLEGRAKWQEPLDRIRIESVDETQFAVFYTNFWKSMIFPRYLQEVTATGEEMHRSPYTGEVKSGKLVADSGFWDSYITVYQLQSLVFAENLGSLIDGWVDAYKEAKWLPQWASPGQRGSMVGTMGDVVLADAIAKSKWGLLGGFDVDKAYEAIRKDAFSQPDGLFGRKGLNNYVEKGYVGGEESEAVSRTLNYYVSDAAIARAAALMGKYQDEQTLRARSKRYGVMFNKRTKFFQLPMSDGKFPEYFDPLDWHDAFTEGSAWQYRFYLPHDVEGLQNLYDGQLCDDIKAMMHHTSGHAYTPRGIIHEMEELGKIHSEFGYYAHNNQPVHHVLYVAKKAGCNDVADKYLRKVMKQLYTKQGWSGDEDNGEMASWYILSALGIYALEGAKDELVLGSPAVKQARVLLPNNKVLTVAAQNQDDNHVYVRSVIWTPADGVARTITGNVMRFTELMQGGKLTFYMASEPSPSNAAASPHQSNAAASPYMLMQRTEATHERMPVHSDGEKEHPHSRGEVSAAESLAAALFQRRVLAAMLANINAWSYVFILGAALVSVLQFAAWKDRTSSIKDAQVFTVTD